MIPKLLSGDISAFCSLITSFLITIVIIPSVIRISKLKGLTDKPDGIRKLHERVIPTLGGVAMFAGFLISYGIWSSGWLECYSPALIAALTILFFSGIKDDILDTGSWEKLAGQVIAAGIVVFAGKIKIGGLDGLFGITSFPWVTGELFTIIAIVIIINAYNLIDGIDGLAGGIAILGSFIFGAWFLLGGHYSEAVLSFSLSGALAGFLAHNLAPAKIFMGDTGSQLIGLVMGILGFRLMELNAEISSLTLNTPAVFIFSVMIIPLFDTLRVVIIRLSRGIHPMKADCRHVHHCLLRMGLKQSQIVVYLSFCTTGIILTTILTDPLNIYFQSILIMSMAALILPLFAGIRMLSGFLGSIVSQRKAASRGINPPDPAKKWIKAASRSKKMMEKI